MTVGTESADIGLCPFKPKALALGESDYMSIPLDQLQAVAFLCEERVVEHRRERVPIATIFFVAVPEGNASDFLYAVTARHCIEDSAGNLFLRVNKEGLGFHDIPTRRDDWKSHDNADVAVVPFAPDVAKYPAIQYKTLPLWCFVGPGPAYVYSGPPLSKPYSLQPSIGHEAYFLGLFSQDWGKERNLPVARFGHISRMPDKLKLKRNRGTTSFEAIAYLVESHSWGGHSGSPVFFMHPMTSYKEIPTDSGNATMVMIGNCVGLLGLVSAHYTIPTKAEVTGDVLGKIETELNSGIMVVTPAHAIEQLLKREDLVKDRLQKKMDADKNKRLPSMDSNAVLEKPFTQDDFQSALRKASRRIVPSESDAKKK